MTLRNLNIFRVTGLLCGEFTGHRWTPPHKGQWRGAIMFSLICAWTSVWLNNRDAGDFGRHHGQYDVTVCEILTNFFTPPCITFFGAGELHAKFSTRLYSIPKVQSQTLSHWDPFRTLQLRYNERVASQITGVSSVCSTVASGVDQRKYQSSASLAFVWGIHRWMVNYPHKGPVTRKMLMLKQVIEQTIQLPVVWDTSTLTCRHCNVIDANIFRCVTWKLI